MIRIVTIYIRIFDIYLIIIIKIMDRIVGKINREYIEYYLKILVNIKRNFFNRFFLGK